MKSITPDFQNRIKQGSQVYKSPKIGYATLSHMPTYREKLGGLLNAEERELAYQKAQPNPDQNAIAISERAVQRRKEELDEHQRSETGMV